ncbi:DUF6993 domain-containing protein [Microbacterium sp. Marseille-Q6965]|uniref:DUF6993 domain-containing protein n=1 Tax=Microbacterium sp. Marseille-Q6965 TaxID=2965072 RepID=UPI0021B800CF|nr:hypothetical protein [Microbacterium sp. Marseille-Q6965]
MSTRRAALRSLALIALTWGALGLAACAPEPKAASTATATPAPAVPAPTASAAAEPVVIPDGTATDNLPVFASVVAQVWASERRAEGRAYVDALVAAGFDKGAMQVTRDLSTVGNPSESILFSVRWGTECLIGQVGPETGEPVATVQPALGARQACLLGDTRPIDW